MPPYDFYKIVVLEKTWYALVASKFLPLEEGEFLWYIGIWLMLLTCSGLSRTDFWLTEMFDEQSNACPYNFNAYMSKRQFNAIKPVSYASQIKLCLSITAAFGDQMIEA